MLLALCPVSAHAEGQTIVHAGTVEELRSALADNTKIVLEGTDYSIGYLGVDGLDNVTIQGTEGTRILTEYEGNFALDIGNSDIVLEDISICLDPPEGSWHDTELFIVALILVPASLSGTAGSPAAPVLRHRRGVLPYGEGYRVQRLRPGDYGHVYGRGAF